MDHFLSSYGYLALFAATFLSSMGIPVGSEVAIGYGGALASGQITDVHHHFSLAAVIIVAAVGEICGSFAGYAIGRFGGRPLVDRWGKYILLTHTDLDRAESWLDGRGEWFVLFGRFIPLLRSFVSVVAGLAEMAIVRFTVFTVIGCTLWCAALASLGYSLGSTWHHVLQKFSYAGYVVAVLIVLALAFAIWHRLRTLRAEREGGTPRGAHAPGAQAARAQETDEAR
jgi:membrane protein DedA with SNARE-associated domain